MRRRCCSIVIAATSAMPFASSTIGGATAPQCVSPDRLRRIVGDEDGLHPAGRRDAMVAVPFAIAEPRSEHGVARSEIAREDDIAAEPAALIELGAGEERGGGDDV